MFVCISISTPPIYFKYIYKGDVINNMYDNIPKLLKDLNIWLCYDARDRASYKGLSKEQIEDNKKAPRDIKGKKASTKKRLYTFNECMDSVKNGFNSGIGIYLKNGLVCIDYDNVIDRIEIDSKYQFKKVIFKDKDRDRIQRDINLINSYTEISPSGKGIHIYLIANTNLKNINTDLIEIYNNHFIRLTGDVYNDFIFNDIEDKTEQLDQLISIYGLDKKDANIKHNILDLSDSVYQDILFKQFKGQKNKYTDNEILQTMFNSDIGEYLQKLYNNTITEQELLDYKGKLKPSLNKKDFKVNVQSDFIKMLNADSVDTSNSGKSMTLIMHLYHFSYGDIKAIKRLFKKSALCKTDYLKCKYNGKDKIDAYFIPRAIQIYKNYS